jgi:predicted transcriptional regulator
VILAETLEKHIGRYFKENEKLSKQKLVGSIKKDFPDWSDNTINMYLSKLKKEGIINAPSRGVYEMDSNISFQPNISASLKRVFNKVKREFPYITFCIWDTVWLNNFMRHQAFKHYVVMEVEKDVAESVFTFLTEINKNVFINPDEEIFDRYIHNQDDVLIVKNMVTESPLAEKDSIVIPALEKLLVDMLIDTNLFSAQQNEKEFIMRSVMEKYTLNELKMRRYAVRRNREREIDELINISLA